MLNRSRSISTNNSAPSATQNWRSARDHGSYEPNPYESNYGQFLPSGSQFSPANPDSRGSIAEQRSFGRRVPSFGSASFPTQHHHHRSAVQIIIFDPQPPREPNPWPRRGPPPPRPIEERHYPPPRAAEERYARSNSRATEQQNKVLESLSRVLYSPSTKRITNKVNLYYRDTPVDPRDIANEDDGKRCAVCLEDFERGHEVTVTPCKHMFHEDCIVPWAKSNPQCPVCRFVFGPKPHEPSSSSFSPSPSPFNINAYNRYFNDRTANMVAPGLTTQEFLSILRALGDGFQL